MSYIREIRDELRGVNPSPKDARVFAVILAAVFAFVGWRVFGNEGAWSRLAYGASAAALLVGFFAWKALSGLYRGWMAVAIVLGSVVMRVILTAAYLAMILPIGLVFRLIGKDPMRRKLEPDASTYWLPVEPVVDRASYLRKF